MNTSRNVVFDGLFWKELASDIYILRKLNFVNEFWMYKKWKKIIEKIEIDTVGIRAYLNVVIR